MCHIDGVLLVTGMQMEMGIALVPNEYYCYGVRFLLGDGGFSTTLVVVRCSWVNKNRNVNDRENMRKQKKRKHTLSVLEIRISDTTDTECGWKNKTRNLIT